MSVWDAEYVRQKAIPREQHISNDWESFAADQEDANYRIDLAKPARVYSDFFVPADRADALVGELESLGYECLFVGGDAEGSEPTFVHTRREAIWAEADFKSLSPKLLDLWEQFDAAYDGSFMISVDEDEPG